MFELASEELRVVIQQLDQSIYNHEQWSKRLVRTLLCDTPPDEHDIAVDAHRHCLFGQWFYNRASPMLQKEPGFIAIGIEHQRMHEQAARLLRKSGAGGVIPTTDYDAFENVLDRLRLEIHTLKREFSEMLYNRDPLTGTNSRLGLLTTLREHQEMVRRGVQACSVALFDVDHFKDVNDEFGHVVGDKVLFAFASYLTQHSRPYDKVFRYGGEEFVVCMPGLTADHALGTIERLRMGIGENAILHEGREIRVTASCGIVALDPGVSVEDCLDRADMALYAAKSAGRNCSRAWRAK
jgi:diguanylate cyclase (GGDEF)-like protein